MLSLSQFRLNIFPVFRLMKSTGCVFEIVYKNKVYDLHVKETKKVPKRTRAKKLRKGLAPINVADITTCDYCGSIHVAGVCMNTKCPTNT